MYCPRCGYANRYDARYCNSCSAPMPDEPRVRVHNAGIAAVLSFFWCGLGQVYNGQIGKGLVMMGAYAVSLWPMWVIVGFITTPILWVWGIYDAYRTAERLNRQAAGAT